jgi:hypothetical protein
VASNRRRFAAAVAVVNRRATWVLAMKLPTALLARADEVIE